MRRLKCLIFGLGQVGQKVAAALLAEGADIVGAYSRASQLGVDLGTAVGVAPAGIKVQAVNDFHPVAGAADIALFFTTSHLGDLLNEGKACLEAGINVLTIAEDALFPWPFDPETAHALDAAAKAGGVSLVATGVNDVVMAHLPACLAALTHGVRAITVETVGDFGKFGARTLEGMPLGLTPAQFAAAEPDEQGPITAQVVAGLAALCGLTAKEMEVEVEPILAGVDLYVSQLDREITQGCVCGLREIARLETAEGVRLQVELIGKIFEPNDTEHLHARVEADETLDMRVAPLPGVAVTAGIALSRIADTLAAPPGFVTFDRLPNAKFNRLAVREIEVRTAVA